MKEGRKERRKDGRKEGRKGGRKGGRKEGRKGYLRDAYVVARFIEPRKVSVPIPRRPFRQKFLPFSGRAALPVLGRKSAVCRGNVFVAANIPFQESSETKTTYSRGVEYFCGLHWAFLPGTVTAMRKTNLQRLSFHLHLQIWLPSYHICVFAFEGFLCGMITKGLKSV